MVPSRLSIGLALHLWAAHTSDGFGAAGSYSEAPIAAPTLARNSLSMSSDLQLSQSPAQTSAGHEAAEPPIGAVMSPATAITAIAGIEATLRALERECLHVARAWFPLDEPSGICGRYRAAAAGWPATSDAPSYERLAAILATLHEAAADVRLATDRCRRVRELLPELHTDAADRD